MPVNITNKNQYPLDIALWLATDDYDYLPDTISVTTLLRPVRQIVLSKRADKVGRDMDLESVLASRYGSAIHDSIEKAWNSPKLSLNLMKLGYRGDEIKLVRVNPTEHDTDMFNVYMEQRLSKEFNGYTIVGKFDLILNGQLKDHKSTGVYGYMKGNNATKHTMQGSLYRWLDGGKIITHPDIGINYIFTDWSKLDSIRNANYPKSRIVIERYPLIPMVDIEQYVLDKTNLIRANMTTPEKDLPPCSPEDLWADKETYKYYANPERALQPKSRCDKSFDTMIEAQRHMVEKGKGTIVIVQGKVRACHYCAAYAICTQKDALHRSGLLPSKP